VAAIGRAAEEGQQHRHAAAAWLLDKRRRALCGSLKNCASIVLSRGVTGLVTSGVHTAFPAT
jgi:hypothetical protein